MKLTIKIKKLGRRNWSWRVMDKRRIAAGGHIAAGLDASAPNGPNGSGTATGWSARHQRAADLANSAPALKRRVAQLDRCIKALEKIIFKADLECDEEGTPVAELAQKLRTRIRRTYGIRWHL